MPSWQQFYTCQHELFDRLQDVSRPTKYTVTHFLDLFFYGFLIISQMFLITSPHQLHWHLLKLTSRTLLTRDEMSKLCKEHLKWFSVKEFNKEFHCTDESVLSMANGTGWGRGKFTHVGGRLGVLLQRGDAAAGHIGQQGASLPWCHGWRQPSSVPSLSNFSWVYPLSTVSDQLMKCAL